MVLLVGGWPAAAGAETVRGFEPAAELMAPEITSDPAPGDGGGAYVPGLDLTVAAVSSGDAVDTQSDGVRGWFAGRGQGLAKGVLAGLVGAAILVGAALLVTPSAPVLLIAAPAVLSGAIYGLSAGSQGFHWGNAVLASVVAGVSAGIGSWLAGAASPLLTKIGALAATVAGGGIAGPAPYLSHSPGWTWQGALRAAALGAGVSSAFAGLGAVMSKVASVLSPLATRFWTWFGRTRPAEETGARAMVAAALAAPSGPDGIRPIVHPTQSPMDTAAAYVDELTQQITRVFPPPTPDVGQGQNANDTDQTDTSADTGGFVRGWTPSKWEHTDEVLPYFDGKFTWKEGLEGGAGLASVSGDYESGAARTPVGRFGGLFGYDVSALTAHAKAGWGLSYLADLIKGEEPSAGLIGVSAGASLAKADVNFGFRWGRVGVSFQLGVNVGVGADLGLDLEHKKFKLGGAALISGGLEISLLD